MNRLLLAFALCLWAAMAPAGENPDIGDLLRIVKEQQAAIADLQRQLNALSGNNPEEEAGSLESRLARLEEAVDEMSDVYASDSVANRLDNAKRELSDLTNRIAWIEATLRTMRIYGAP